MITVAFLVAMTFTHIVMAGALWPLLRNGYQDFTIFFAAGQMVRHGQTAALYDLDRQYQAQQQFAPDVQIRHGALPYNHPPFEALIFLPLTFFRYLTAYLIWSVLNFLFLSAAVVRLHGKFSTKENLPAWLMLLASAGFFPVAIAMIQGQDSMLLLLVFVFTLVDLARGRDVRAGAVLALGLFKFHLVVPVAILLALRKWRILAGFIPVAAVLTGISVAMLGWREAWGYVWFLLHVENSGAGGAIVPEDMPNLHGLAACLGGGSETFVISATVIGGAIIFVMAAVRIRRAQTPISVSFLLATAATTLISYHLLAYDLSLLFPAAVFLFATEMQANDWLKSTVLLLLFMTPVYVFSWFYLGKLGFYALAVVGLFGVLYRTCWNGRGLQAQAS